MPSSSSNDKTVIFVTGSTEGGIGASICEEYSKNHKNAIIYAGVRKLEALGSLTKDKKIIPLIVDVTNDESVEKAVSQIIQENGQIDILINNAGINSGSGIAIEVPIDRYRQTFEVNYFGLIRVTQKVAIHMAKRKKGAIVNIGSVSGFAHLPLTAAYSNSKAAVHSFSDVLRIELAPLGIHVLCVAPGKIKSSFGKQALEGCTLPSPDSPFYSARDAIQARANYSQVGKSTPSSELAKAIRSSLEKPKLFRRAYLTYGEASSAGWLLYFLPSFMRDRALIRRFKLYTIAHN